MFKKKKKTFLKIITFAITFEPLEVEMCYFTCTFHVMRSFLSCKKPNMNAHSLTVKKLRPMFINMSKVTVKVTCSKVMVPPENLVIRNRFANYQSPPLTPNKKNVFLVTRLTQTFCSDPKTFIAFEDCCADLLFYEA